MSRYPIDRYRTAAADAATFNERRGFYRIVAVATGAPRQQPQRQQQLLRRRRRRRRSAAAAPAVAVATSPSSAPQ